MQRMNWTEVWQIILCAVGSAGGIGAIIVLTIKWSANRIAERLSKKYDLKLQKELEQYKANVENKIYISKTKFDTEFQLYRRLSKCCNDMVKEVAQLFPTFTKDMRDNYERYKPEHDRAVEAIIIAQDEIRASAPFISAELYEQFTNLEKLCKQQLSDFQDFRLRPDAEDFRRDCNEAFRDTYKRTREIDESFKMLQENMRTYIAKLDVIER